VSDKRSEEITLECAVAKILMDNWFNCNGSKVDNSMTIQEACQRLGKSESTVRRMIKTGRLIAIKKDGIYDIPEDAVNDLSNGKQAVGNDKANEQVENPLINQLKEENKYLKERITELEDARMRADQITMQLTRQLEASQRMLTVAKEPFWRRIFKQKPENK